MKKVVLQLDLHDDKEKRTAMKAVSSISGIDSIAIDMKDRKLTVVGAVDPVEVVNKLRKRWHTEILLVGPAVVEPQKKKEDPPKKPEPEKKKEEPKKAEPEKKKDPNPNDQVAELVKAYQAYNPHMTTHYYVHSAEENPNACVIC